MAMRTLSRLTASLMFCSGILVAVVHAQQAPPIAQQALPISWLIPLFTHHPPTNAPFFFMSFLGKCLDVSGATNNPQTIISVAVCTQASSQRITINEVGPGREVILQAAGKCLGPGLNLIVPQMPLTLRDCDNSDLQKFVLDGDSIIAATDRDMVVEVRNGVGETRTQVWFNRRDLNDPEFWKLIPVDATSRPTSGFVRVPDDGMDLATALSTATVGSVTQLNMDIKASANQHMELLEGVTLRGGRQGIDLGPEVSADKEDNDGLFVIQSNNTRITGLRVRGPSRNTQDVPQAVGIFVNNDFHAIVDHNDISDWPNAAVEVHGPKDDDCQDRLQDDGYTPEPWDSCCARAHHDHRTQVIRVFVVRNFIHHNRLQGRGYGVVAYNGAYPRIEGNTSDSSELADFPRNPQVVRNAL